MKFRLAGINNQNFIMRDEETGSWWQQVTGEAIFGSLRGQRLNLIQHDELSFSVWKEENPDGRVLQPDENKPGHQFSKDWEERTAQLPVFAPLNSDASLSPRTQIVGVKIGAKSKAYPLQAIQQHGAILDQINDTLLLVVVAEDKKSVRVFDRRIDGRSLELFAKPDSRPLRLLDAQTGSEWDFRGRCVSGEYTGRELKKVYSLHDYWFDWKAYNPDTAIYH